MSRAYTQSFPFATQLSFLDRSGKQWWMEYDGTNFWTYDHGKAQHDTDPFALWPEEYWEMLVWWCLTLWGDE